MRTTVTFDDEATAAIERVRRETGDGVSKAVNDLIKSGLAVKGAAGSRAPFKQASSPVGVRIDVSNVAEALEQLDE